MNSLLLLLPLKMGGRGGDFNKLGMNFLNKDLRKQLEKSVINARKDEAPRDIH